MCGSLTSAVFSLCSEFWRDRRGQDMMEWAMLVALLAVVIVGFLPFAAIPAMSTIYSKIISVASVLVPN
jgi:Flp pilus assembly pilin Flp